jgi:hypothetical protein
MRIIYLARKQPANSSIERLRAIIGNLAYRWMYGEKPMAMLIDQARPVAIRGRRFNDLDDSSFVNVEDPTRFSDSGYWELGMEASVVSPNLEAYPAFLHQTE